MKFLVVVSMMALMPGLAHATGAFQCASVDQEHWLSEAALTDKLTEAGWQVRRMKVDGGCWEVYGTMPDGKRVEAYFTPDSGEAQYISQRGTVLFDIRDQ